MEHDYKLPRSVVGWIYNHSKANYWRVASFYEFDDLVHDGLMKAYACQARYGTPGVDVDEPHFQSLVKTAFRNHIGDILRKHRRVNDSKKFADFSQTLSETDVLDRIAEPTQPEQDFASFVATLPDSLRKVVQLYLSSPEKTRNLRVRLNGSNETLSERLHRLTGFPLERDFETEFRAFLWEDDKGLA